MNCRNIKSELIELKPATKNQKPVLDNLLEKYNYEFSQYDRLPLRPDGTYGFDDLDEYWTDENKKPYLIWVDGELAGFVMVNKHPDCHRPIDRAIAEFFITYNYRRTGVGTFAAQKILEMFKGYWHIRYHPLNKGSEAFWNRIANQVTDGNYEVLKGVEDYFDGSESKVIFFSNL